MKTDRELLKELLTFVTDNKYHFFMDEVKARLASPEPDPPTLRKMANFTTWLAFIWNDHNFRHTKLYAEELCECLGIRSFAHAKSWANREWIDFLPPLNREPVAWLYRQHCDVSNITLEAVTRYRDYALLKDPYPIPLYKR
jgi:hypothetical protein